MNNRLKILYPSLLAIAVVLGILLGSNMQKRTVKTVSNPMSIFQPDKLSILLKYIEKDYVDSVNTDEIIEKIIPDLLNELDPHTSYIPAKDMKAVNEDMRGNFSGIGVQFVMQNDTVMIVDVITGGPSHKLGILAGDRIVRVNQDTIAGIGIKSDEIVGLLRGKKGTEVNVSIHRPGFDELLEFEIERGEIPIFSVDVAYMITKEIGLIKVNRFAETTYNEFITGINQLADQGAKKLIVDLRGNSGGILQMVYQMVDEFLPANSMIVYTQGNSHPRQNYKATARGIWEDKEVTVLIDEFSASASEIFAGAIQDNDRGLVIGRRSFGKGLVQEPIPFLDGSVLRLTIARFYTPSGRCIQQSYEEGNEAYRNSFHERIVNNEFSQKDSIHFNDSLKYQTIGGRTVFGGGGIMPDIFVPIDTVGFNELYTSIVRKNLVYYFAFDYADKNRKELNKYKTPQAMEDHLIKTKLFDQFIAHVKSKGILVKTSELNESKLLLKAQLHAYVSRNIIGDEGFYPVLFKIDKTVKKAVNTLEEKTWTSDQIAKLNPM